MEKKKFALEYISGTKVLEDVSAIVNLTLSVPL